MKLCISIISLTSLLILGCTATEIKIKPENALISKNVEPYAAVGLKDVSSSPALPEVGNMTEAFIAEIKKSKFAKEVYYPSSPDDKAEIVLEANFDVVFNPHFGVAPYAKTFSYWTHSFYDRTLVPYNFEYKFSGTVDVLKNGKMIKQVSAVTEAILSMQWLSLGSIATLETETLNKAKKSLFQQLLYDLSSHKAGPKP